LERGWERRKSAPAIGRAELLERLRPYAGGRPILATDVLSGGAINLNIHARLEDPPEDVVLRLYLLDPGAAAKEAALLRLVEGTVPAPRVLDIGGPEARPHLVLSHVPGIALTELLAREDEDAHARAGREVGAALATLHAHARDELGFLDGGLEIPAPMGSLREVWLGFLRSALFEGRAGSRLGAGPRDDLWRFAEENAPRLAALEGRYALLHADCKPTNVRVAEAGALTGLLDWEFAWSGPPLFDLGQMFRWPVPQAYERALLGSYAAGGGWMPPHARRCAALLDLLNLVGFLDTAEERPVVFRDCKRLIRASCGL